MSKVHQAMELVTVCLAFKPAVLTSEMRRMIKLLLLEEEVRDVSHA
jgi:hypothetical protein